MCVRMSCMCVHFSWQLESRMLCRREENPPVVSPGRQGPAGQHKFKRKSGL